jgi:hypothetical protein
MERDYYDFFDPESNIELSNLIKRNITRGQLAEFNRDIIEQNIRMNEEAELKRLDEMRKKIVKEEINKKKKLKNELIKRIKLNKEKVYGGYTSKKVMKPIEKTVMQIPKIISKPDMPIESIGTFVNPIFYRESDPIKGPFFPNPRRVEYGRVLSDRN